MSIQQFKRELESLKQRINSHNSQVECHLSSAKEEVKRDIARISGRIRESGEVYALNEVDKEALLNTILESCNDRVKNPYFKRWVGSF
ncbi:hypothetical protein [Methanosarcina sp. WWM596]|uniref:hypothetical protein n=1 Tax=Methanosarcina sp. WWM596 TaxID=1434103 RepID=UPI0006161F1D|nr:hypothetical protein [Methanosarcina sp. WWM596]AKB19538.1 hypothetical protein MSWHS_2675 [Methanosarcina sp. WWM596]